MKSLCYSEFKSLFDCSNGTCEDDNDSDDTAFEGTGDKVDTALEAGGVS